MNELCMSLLEEIYRLQPDGCGKDIFLMGYKSQDMWEALLLLKKEKLINGCILGGSVEYSESQIADFTNDETRSLIHKIPHKLPQEVRRNLGVDDTAFDLGKWSKLNLTHKGEDELFGNRCGWCVRNFSNILSVIAMIISIIALFKG